MKKELVLKIEALEEELAKLKEELNRPEKFEFKYESNNLYCILSDSTDCFCDGPTKSFLENFRYRQTEANAEADFQLQKELMCVSALAEQIDPGYKARAALDNAGWMVCRNIVTKKYIITNKSILEYLGVVYMPLDVAERVCSILNNKEVEL